MLPHEKIQPVEPADVTECRDCGKRYLPGLTFIAFNNAIGGGDDIPIVETYDPRPGIDAVRTRDPYHGATTMVNVAHPQMCSDCVTMAAAHLRYGDQAPLYDQINELEAKKLNLQSEVRKLTTERDEAEEVARDLRVQLRIAERRKPKSAKRSQPAAA